MPQFHPDEIDAARGRLAKLQAELASAPSLEEVQRRLGVVEGYAKALGDLDVLPWTECNVAFLAAMDAAHGWTAPAQS